MTARADLLANDPTSGIECHRPDDRFIPLRAVELAAAIACDSERFGRDAGRLSQVVQAIDDVVEQEAQAFERQLCERYAAFNPDCDTIHLNDLAALRMPGHYGAMLERLDYLLRKANFSRLQEIELDAAVRAANTYRLRVRLRPERVESVAVWVRGRGTVERRVRRWRRPFRVETRAIPVFRRLVVVARLRDDPHVVLKLFKEIPVADVEALLPHAEVRMGWLDQIRVVGGGAGMAGSAAGKVLTVAAQLAFWSKWFVILLITGGILTVRGLMGYRSARERRDSQRTRHLYYQNLDNNLGVIHALVGMIAQEELKEAFLAYAFCHAGAGALRGVDDLRRRIESYLNERFGVQVQFDQADALDTLQRLDLWNDRAGLRVLPPDVAVDRLRAHWRARRTAHCHEVTVSLNPS